MPSICPELVNPITGQVLAELPVEHAINVKILQALEGIDCDTLLSLLKTVDYATPEGEIPQVLFPVILQHQASILPLLEGLGIQHNVQKFIEWSSEPSDWACSKAALKGQISWLRFAHQQGLFWDERTPVAAAAAGSLECLQYAIEHGCPATSQTCVMAAKKGSLQCLAYAHSKGVALHPEVCLVAAQRGFLACLRYAHEEGCPWAAGTCAAAAAKSLECLQYALDNGCPGGQYVCPSAAKAGRLMCLQYAHEHGCSWNQATPRAAALHRHFDCLRYAIEHGCPTSVDLCIWALRGGSLACVRYLRERGFPWNESDQFIEKWPKTYRTAWDTTNPSLVECLLYAFNSGAPIDPDKVCHRVIRHNSLHLLECVYKRGGKLTEKTYRLACGPGISKQIVRWLDHMRWSESNSPSSLLEGNYG